MSQFRKLVSNLSLSPQTGSQLVFYARRLRQERATRSLAAVAAVLALIVNLAAATIAKPATTLASSPNDMVFGGITSDMKTGVLNIYDQNRDQDGHTDIQAIFNYFGISRADLTNASPGTISSSDHSLLSMGRVAHSSQDQLVPVPGASTTLYLRPLWTWGDNLTYNALIGHNLDGSLRFAVMQDCGNLVVKTLPPAGPPQLTISKNVMPGTPAYGSSIAPGSIIGYRISFANTGASAASAVYVEDAVPTNTSFVWMGTGAAPTYAHLTTVFPSHESAPTDHVYWRYPSLPAGATGYYVDFQVKVDSNTPNGTEICNIAYIRSDQTAQQSTGLPICFFVKTTAPITAPPPTPTPQPQPTPPPTPSPTPAPIPSPTPVPTSATISKSKAAVNITLGNKDATKQAANAGDVIEYTLRTINSGNGTEKGFVATDDLHDILEYADLLDPRGGTLGSDSSISWPKTDVKAGTTLIDSFEVKVKNPIPTTPTSVSDPQSFDYRMDDVYGTAVTVPIAKPIPGQVETAAQTLPQTGPAGSLILLIFAAFVVYFFLRNRQLAQEIRILRVEQNNGV